MIRLKTSVSLDNTRPEVFKILYEAAQIWAKYGSRDLTVTSANEAGHLTGPRGFHRLPDGTCQAVDLRIWSLPQANRGKAADDLAEVLGPLFDVLLEVDHVHVQFDPDRPGTNR